MEIVKLIGADVLPDSQKATLEVAKTIRVGFLQQNAFHADDTYVPLEKQNKMMDTILLFDKRIKECGRCAFKGERKRNCRGHYQN